MAKLTKSKTRDRIERAAPQTNALPIDARARTVSRSLLALVLVSLALFLSQDFLAPIGWAAVIAITLWPLYLKFKPLFGAIKESSLPALLFTLLVGAFLFMPIALAAHRASVEIQVVEQSLNGFRQNGIPVPQWLPALPAVGEPATRWWTANLKDAGNIAHWIGAPATSDNATMTRFLAAEVLTRLSLFIIALIALFGFLRNGAWIANRFLETADRLLGEPGERLASKMLETIRGTVNGTVLVALVEGALIGVVYFVAGIPNALLFTLLTMAFAMLPFGAWAVFASASLLLILSGGSVLAATAVFGLGAAVMVIGDLFFWPALVGGAARLPFLVALIGIFGGLQLFGLIGLFLGPVIMAALLIVWREWLMPRK